MIDRKMVECFFAFETNTLTKLVNNYLASVEDIFRAVDVQFSTCAMPPGEGICFSALVVIVEI